MKILQESCDSEMVYCLFVHVVLFGSYNCPRPLKMREESQMEINVKVLLD